MKVCVTIQAIGMAVFLLVARPCAAADDAYDEASLDGTYRAHDLFALRNGNGEIALGVREIDGNGRISSLVDFAGRTPLDYEVLGDGRLRWSAPNFAPGIAGSIGLGGGIAAYAPSLGAGQDSQVSGGYAALRLSLAEGAGYDDADFKGAYSYHALVYRGTRWWNVFGAADVNGTSRVRLVRGTASPFDRTYNVNSDGSVTIGSGAAQAATILAGGELLVQATQIGSGVDPLYSSGYDGLAFYLKRDTSAAPFDPGDFEGSYNIVELRVKGNGNVSTRLGRITAGAAGLFYGSLGGSAFDGRARFFDSGVFTVDGLDGIDATMGADGDVAVVTDRGGLVNNGTGEAFLQLWLRVAGGAPTARDSDGDGLSDGAEDTLGTDAEDRDSDNDGVLDNEDERPLTADNIFTAALSETSLSLSESANVPEPLTLTLDSKDFPYFTWSLSDNADWVRFSESSGTGDGQTNVFLETSSLAARAQPYEAIITVTAPGMKAVSPITLSVQIRQDSIGLSLTPGDLNFSMSENGALPASQTIRVAATASQDFAWSIATTGPWLSVQPASGTGPRDVTVSVRANALPASDGPYSSSLTATSGEEEAFSTAFLRVYSDRTPGVPFLAADSNAIAGHSLGLTDTEALLLYSDGADVFAVPFDGRAVPRTSRIRMDGPLGVITGPTAAVIDPATRTALCIWEEASSTSVSSLITAREIDLATLALGNAFVIAAAEGNVRAPSLVFDRARNRCVMACLVKNGDTSAVRVGFFARNAARDVVLNTVYTESDAERDITSVALALNSGTGDALVCWRDLDTSPARNGQGRIAGLVARADRSIAAAATTFNDETRYPEPPAAAFDAARPGWVITWQEGARNGAELEKATRYSARQALLGPAYAFDVPIAAAADRGVAATYSGASRRTLAATVDADSRINYYQATPLGNVIAGPVALEGDATQYAPAAYTTPDGRLHWLIYGAGQDVFAVRLAAGDSDKDDDGLEDDWELLYGLDPESSAGIDGGAGDPDQDGLSNEEEQRMGTNPRLADTDGDGLPDRVEDEDRDGIVDSGESGATQSDTDNDGADDAVERFAGTDPGNAASRPASGIYGADYGAFRPGATTPVVLRVYAAQAGTYRLSLNATELDTWAPPTGWGAVPAGGTELALAAGTHLLTLNVTPSGSIAPPADHGSFRFAWGVPGGAAKERALVLVCDARPPSGLSTAQERALAEQYAPIVRHSSGEHFLPAPVDLSTALAAMRFSDGGGTARSLGLDGPALQPFAEAELDQPGASVAELRAAYANASGQYPSAVYYTVTRMDGPTASALAPPPGVVVQYYLHYFADDWEELSGAAHRHEGDWEVAQISFTGDGFPRFMTAGAYPELGGAGDVLAESTAWDEVEKHSDGRPILYAGRGSHALHFRPMGARVNGALDAYDGLGAWAVPRVGTAGAAVSLGYAPEVPYTLAALGRLGSADAPRWLAYAGRWGQRGLPQSPNAAGPQSGGDGSAGPAFLSAAGVSVWSDPFAFETARASFHPYAQTGIRVRLSGAPAGAVAVLMDPRGLPRRFALGPDGSLVANLPIGAYVLALVVPQADGRDVFAGIARGISGEGPRMEILLADRAVNELGVFTRVEGTDRFEGPANWAVIDLDGDGVPDDEDDDINGNGAPGATELDTLGDGWPDAFQTGDGDGDAIPAFFDEDDDGDGLPDALDDDADGDGVPDSEEMPDTDGDGVPDPYDSDQDNDTYPNDVETAAGSDPLLRFDTPARGICDVDGDGEVDAADAQLIINTALGRAGWTAWMDANEDGRIQAIDIATCIRIILESRN